tara:strand:- start:313 stop:1020 length:708 start_codon:yes stop_codon:yes gene_type:complete
MSNYSKTTDFAAKDSLSTGNANKIVKGTEIDDEFDAIQVAVNTKANINNTALTGTPTAPTASASVNTTQLSTTAYVTTAIAAAIAAAKLALYPVGSIYTQAAVATNPGTLLGFGTWATYGAGRVMVGLNGSDSAFDTLSETGGAAAVTPAGTNAGTALSIAQLAAHTHTTTLTQTNGLSSGNEARVPSGGSTTLGTQAYTSSEVGSGATHTHTFSGASQTNLQPYIVVYMWKRTA